MSQGLFRQSAIKHQSARLDGEVVIAQPVSSSLLTAALLAVVTVLVLFLFCASFDRKETVSGYLKPSTGLAKVTAPRTGVVSAVYIEDGQQVDAGQKLLKISVQDQLAEGQSLTARLLESLVQQELLLQQRQQQSERQYQQQQAELHSRFASSEQLIREINKQQQMLQQRLQLNQKRYADYRAISEQGALTQGELDNQKELLLNLQQLLAEQNASEQAQLNLVQQIQGQLARLPLEQQQQQAVLAAELSKLQQQKTELQARGELVLTAPVAGRVTNLVAELGNSISAAVPLLTILPEQAELLAVLLVPTRAYGFVQPGQQARLRFDAFPYQRFGSYQGQVIKTAQAIVLPNEVDMPVAVQEPVYRVEVQLESQQIRAFNHNVPLQSGMLLSADIVLEQRSLMAWLFEPIFSLKGRL
ncbi:HlyD family efflux transporter periplasmic adaptor subunit [Rheinheimera sp.]|uniref:HlyD family secretion protein n=1 Tax=Rheinheimera sp. TaxID=1869214 RepID=UPI00307DAAA5